MTYEFLNNKYYIRFAWKSDMTGFDEIFDGIPVASGATARPAGAPTIMIVDDNPDIAQALRITLEDRYRIIICHGLQSARERLAVGDLDLVLLDIQMAVHDGIECFHELRKDYPRLKIVFHTAFAGSSHKARQAETLDHDGFLYKGDYTEHTLNQTISGALRRPVTSVASV